MLLRPRAPRESPGGSCSMDRRQESCKVKMGGEAATERKAADTHRLRMQRPLSSRRAMLWRRWDVQPW